MPKPIRIDPGDRGMISQATGKPVRPDVTTGSGSAARRAIPVPSTASTMPSSPNTLQTRSARTIPQDMLVQTSSMSSPMHTRTNRPARPAGIDVGSMLRRFGNDVIENDLWSNGAMLSGGSLPRTDGTYPDDTMQVDLPDLNPAVENVRDRLYGMMTQPSGDQVFSAPLSTGASPSVSRDVMRSSEPIDTPDIGASMDTLQDYLRGIVGTTNDDTDMVPVGPSMGNGMTPMVGGDTIKPGEPKDINLPSLPSIDSVRDFLGDVIAEPATGDNLVQLPALANGSTPYVDSNSVAGGDGKNILERDQMWGLIGDTDSNQAYIRDAMENGGLSEKDAKDIMSRGSFWDQLNKKYSQPLIGMDTSSNTSTLGDVTVMDDGSAYDYNHMTADTMTGTQYMHYAEMGMGGRPIEEIDPTKTYSKRRENINYGFTPFVPDQTAFLNMVADNVLDTPYRMGSWLSGLRETVTPDYTINYSNGSVSGRDFDKLATPYLNQFYYHDRFDPERYLSKPKNDGKATALVREYAIPDVDGKTRYAYGDIVDSGYDDTLYLTFSDGTTLGVSPDEYSKWSVSDDGMVVPESYYQAHGDITDSGYDDTFYLTFSDGQRFGVSADYIKSAADENGNIDFQTQRIPANEAHGQLPKDLDVLNDMDRIDSSVSEYGGSPLDYAGVIYIPDLVLSDGTTIPYSDVERIYWDQTPENDEGEDDDDISYDFSRYGIVDNKPRRFTQQEMFKSNGRGGLDVDLSDIGNNAVDWTLGSLPISIGRTMPWIYSVSGATSSLAGADPASYDPTTDSYGLIAGNYDKNGNLRYGVTGADGVRDDERSDSTRWWNAAGNAAVPLTEMLVGPVGEQLVPLERIFNSGLPSNPTTWQVIKNALVGAAGEGVEEDLGNIFDELTQYGPRGMFANVVTDENGKPITDMYGHELRDYGTNAEDRLYSFLDPGQLANSFAGGVAVDALMQALPISSQLAPAVRRDMARRKTGVSQFVDPEERERQVR